MSSSHWPAYQSWSSRSVNCVFATKSFMITGFSFEFCFPIFLLSKNVNEKNFRAIRAPKCVSGERKMAVYRYWYIFGSGWYRIRALYFFLFLCFGRFFFCPERARLLFNFSILPSGGNNLDLIFGKWPADAGAQKNHLANYARFCCNFKSLWFFKRSFSSVPRWPKMWKRSQSLGDIE